MPPNSETSWVRISSTPSMPSRRQTSAALTTTSTRIKIIDQPIGLRTRRGCGSASAASSAGGSFKGISDKAMDQAGNGVPLCLVRSQKRSKRKLRPIHARLRDAHAPS